MADVPLLKGRVLNIGGHPSQVQGVVEGETRPVTLVYDGLGDAAVHAHGEVLAGDEQLHLVEAAVINFAVAEHGGHGVVTDVKGHAQPAAEHLEEGAGRYTLLVLFRYLLSIGC